MQFLLCRPTYRQVGALGVLPAAVLPLVSDQYWRGVRTCFETVRCQRKSALPTLLHSTSPPFSMNDLCVCAYWDWEALLRVGYLKEQDY